MTKLDHNKLHDLKEYFRNKEEGLSLEEFVGVMLAFIDEKDVDYHNEQDDSLILNIIELFKQIDVNDDGTLEWEEFSNHIIESGMSKRESKFVDQIKNYFVSPQEDNSRHEHEIEHVFFFPRLKFLFVMERDLKEFKVYNLRTLQKIRSVAGHRGNITYAEHVWDRDILATCANDLSIILWDVSSWQKKGRIMTNDIQMIMRYHRFDEDSYYFMSAGIDFHIHFYNLDTLKPIKVIQPEKITKVIQPSNVNMHTEMSMLDHDNSKTHEKKVTEKRITGSEYHGHTSTITDILVVGSRDVFFTAGMDAKIVCWDLKIQAYRRQFLGHKKGVLSLAWINDNLISAGLDREAFIWNPYVSKKIYALKGHQHSLIGVKALEDSYQIVTADISASFKIWDARNLSCVQTFNMGTNDLICFTITEPQHKIIGGFKKLNYWDYDEPKDQNLVDENPALNVFFNREFFVFVTIHSTCIKLWDAHNGKLSTVLRDLTKYEIVRGVMDHRQRKIFLADSSGRVSSFNLNNGAKMKKFSKHADEVSDLLYFGEKKFLVTSGWDGHLKISDDDKPDREAQLKFVSKQEADDGRRENVKPLNCMDIFQCYYQEKNKISGKIQDIKQSLLAVGNQEGHVLLYDLSNYRYINIFKQEFSITRIKFLADHPLMCVADESGRICIWAVKPSLLAFKEALYTIENSYTLEEEFKNVGIKCLTYFQPKNWLIVGDNNGVIRIFNLSTLIEKHSNYNNNFLISEGTSVFATELDCKGAEEMVVKDTDIVHVMTFRGHWSPIIDLNVDEYLDPLVLTTSSQDCQVFIWDLNSKMEVKSSQSPSGVNRELRQVGSLIIKGGSKHWNIVPDKNQKIFRQRMIKEEILDKALRIRYAIHDEYSSFNQVREYEESGILDEVNKNLEEMMRRKNIDLRFLLHLQPEEEKNKKLGALKYFDDNQHALQDDPSKRPQSKISNRSQKALKYE